MCFCFPGPTYAGKSAPHVLTSCTGTSVYHSFPTLEPLLKRSKQSFHEYLFRMLRFFFFKIGAAVFYTQRLVQSVQYCLT